MTVSEARRKLEKIQTLIEDLVENFPEEGPGPIATAYAEVEEAGRSIDAAIDLVNNEANEEEEEDDL
jgi:hypothetical protein